MPSRLRENPVPEMKTANDILACLEQNGPISRAAIAKRLGLSRTTISTLMVRFIQQELVSELSGESQGRGRPGSPIDMNTSAWFSLGAEFFSGRWVFVLANLKGEVVRTSILKVASDKPEEFLGVLVEGIRRMQESAPGRLLPAVGIGAPGTVNLRAGTIVRADDLGWKDVRVGEPVEGATGLTAFVINRNRAAALAEARFGGGRETKAFVYIGIGTGISAALMLNGDLLHGFTYSAGEIGHMIMNPDGPQCGCGKRGCLQSLAAEGALVRRMHELHAEGRVDSDSAIGLALAKKGKITGEMIAQEALNGDTAAQECLHLAAHYLGMASGQLITTFNPEKIILGGPLVRVGSPLVEYTRAQAANWALTYPLAYTKIEASQLGEYSGALGAACMVLRYKLELTTPE